jgi:membrane protein YdbS with pleckstrin-like domain
MSSLQKLLVSPTSSVSCRTCGKGVSIRWRHALALLVPAVLAMVLMKVLALQALQILLSGLILIVVAGFIQLLFIPLSRERL